jgi:hypothetical protein
MIEKMGIPTVSIITKNFVNDAKTATQLTGMTGIRIIAIDHPIEGIGEKAIRNNVNTALDKIVGSLTVPLTAEEKKTGVIKQPVEKRIVFTGDVSEVQQYFVLENMSDGLPIIPPTEKAVKAMLDASSHSPKEVLGKMPPEMWDVTVEKVAINGVMAGCKPEYMPVLLTMAEALIDPKMEVNTGARSDTSFAFWAVVNGPIASEIGMNWADNALGPGNRANATLGRALRLMLINLGGSRSMLNDMSSQGNPIKYGLCFAENEKANPWPSLHVERGFKPNESTITIFRGWGFRNIGLTGPSDRLKDIVWSASNIDGRFGIGPNRGFVILMDPSLARGLNQKGYTKPGVRKYVWDNLRRTVREWKESMMYTVDVRAGIWPKEYEQLPDDAYVPKFDNPERIEIVVVGGNTTDWYQIYEAVHPSTGVTKSIDKWR